MRIIAIRHGHSEGNGGNRQRYNEVADTHIPLVPQGFKQAKEVGLWLETMGLTPENAFIVCSPMLRTRQTMGEAIKSSPSLAKLAIVYDWNVREQEGGEHIALYPYHMDEIPSQQRELFHAAGSGRTFWRPPNGESFLDTHARAKQWLKEQWESYDWSPEMTRVVFTHGAFHRALQAAWMGHLEREPYWLETAPNPFNCEAWSLTGGKRLQDRTAARVFRPQTAWATAQAI
jgi:broad specificity phosphatase PhoE